MLAEDEDRALSFFLEVVEPTVSEFLLHHEDRRLGCLACLALSSMAEHYFHARPELSESYWVGWPPRETKDKKSFSATLGQENRAFQQIMNVANATKHVLPKNERIGFDSISTQEITLGNLRAGWPINGKALMVEARPGELWLLSQLVETSIQMWRERLGLPSEP